MDRMTKEDFEKEFSSRESQSWKPWAMIPIKISNTDPASGLMFIQEQKLYVKMVVLQSLKLLKHTFLILMEKLLV